MHIPEASIPKALQLGKLQDLQSLTGAEITLREVLANTVFICLLH